MSSFTHSGWPVLPPLGVPFGSSFSAGGAAAIQISSLASAGIVVPAEVNRWGRITNKIYSIHAPAFCLYIVFAKLGGNNYG
jgi:uncharacterized membrane protein